MEMRQLEYFVAVADEESFTAAAQRVHTTQPNISAQIRGLERELGSALFDRSARSVRLTDAGRAALPAARAALAAAREVTDAVSEVRGLLRGSLSVGMVEGCTIAPLFAALGTFGSAHPKVALSLQEAPSDRLVSSVVDGSLDVALAGYGDELPRGIESLTVIAEPVVAVVPADVEHSASTGLADLRQRSLICLPRGAGIRAVFDDAAVAQGGPIRPAIEASSPDAIVELVCGGMGTGILSASIAAADDRVTGLPIEGVDVRARLGFLWRSDPSPATRRFVDVAHEAFGLGPG
ncbi:LysR family transcriptional regulator [Gordonia alkanivorans]|uniref:LysR family transcriptional regulator n=2 Tax=Gordonia rubripertincta TaxID=36822 RepID=A0AAW4FZE3_GORRU|nr:MULTISPECIES: LysR family transcriptional regulator [Gordonia]MBM7276350.1 LysR family transcriptional regulator [Gordonia rubripertincta]MDG6782174.1 LysR family transcriptional regulator [Gordonia rubripertincta]MDH3024729.1 LysR family transcriptional regulator [Gordonia alkanivorans]NKY65088.1 LysR family transcriptional regulator [Gordonia rubripertincta]QMU21597.1 LysR family transcriptional regulator [Gordonia rubripertincta]